MLYLQMQKRYMPQHDHVYIEDIKINLDLLESFLLGVTYDMFVSDIEKQYAVVRTLEIIGEAVAKLSDAYKSEHVAIDWRGIKDMRNILIHEYAYVDPAEVWSVYQHDVPVLQKHFSS